MQNNKRDGWFFTVKLEMETNSIKDKDEDVRFMKVEGFVNFHKDDYERHQQLYRQIKRKVEFYEKMYDIRVIRYDYTILTRLQIEFLPNPFKGTMRTKVEA